jgi:HK97 family phage major capsid protein
MQTTPRTLGDYNAMRDSMDKRSALVGWARAKACSDGSTMAALAMLERDPAMRPHLEAFQKSAVEAMTATSATSGGPLAALRSYGAAFLGPVKLRTVLGRMIGVITAPPNTRIAAQNDTSTLADFVGESEPVPVAPLSFENFTLPPTKLAIASPFTRELARSSDPAAGTIIEADLVRRVAGGTDVALLDPTRNAIPGVRPASLTFGATEVPSSGILDVDIALLLASISGGQPVAPYLAMSPRSALYLATRRGTNGERLFPDVGLSGGFVLGVPVLVASAGAGDRVVAIDAAGVVVTDLGVELDAADAATLEMTTTPSNTPGGAGSPEAPVARSMVSLWQTNSIAIKAVRFVNWVHRADAVAYLELSGSPLP